MSRKINHRGEEKGRFETMEKSISRRRKLGIALSVILIIAMLLIGTFALILPSQHGSNVFTGRGDGELIPSVKLVDTYNPGDGANWIFDQWIPKRVSVFNDGDVPVFVKLHF